MHELRPLTSSFFFLTTWAAGSSVTLNYVSSQFLTLEAKRCEVSGQAVRCHVSIGTGNAGKGFEVIRDSKVRLTEKRSRGGGYVIAERAAVFEGLDMSVICDGRRRYISFTSDGEQQCFLTHPRRTSSSFGPSTPQRLSGDAWTARSTSSM